MCSPSLVKGKRPMKDKVSQSWDGRALPFLPLAQEEEVEVAGSGSWPCTYILCAWSCAGETAGKSFILENVLWLPSCPVLLQWIVSRWVVCWQKCLMGEYTACGCYFWNSQKPLRKKLLPAALWAVILHPFVHWETSWEKACRHLQGGRNECFWLFK